MDEIDAIPISALNHYAYCPRRCFLIHAEREFEDNIHTLRGNFEHERADQIRHEVSANGARVERALPVWSDRLGLSGKCDVVEFHPDGRIYPVEYKHGKRKKWINDDLQLAAQAMCLEEMTGGTIGRGAIYHASSRRRREVSFTDELRGEVKDAVEAIRKMLGRGELPAPVNDARCKECSLNQICQPEAVAGRSKLRALKTSLFIIEEER